MVNFLKFLSTKRPLASEPKVSSARGAPSAPFSETSRFPSRLLNDVLGQVPFTNRPRNGEGEAKSAALTLSQRLNVGARLGDASRRTTEAASKLAALVDPETAQTLDLIVKDLESRACRIAFVGQMNAGKSSLINVLVEQAELLPADINPWTTVITNLHFGVPGALTSGASFTFFSLDEWRRLSVGGRTRELTERIFPDFDWEALRGQIEAMRARAEQKLGPRFEEMLGTEHFFPALTPGLLNRYVGAGTPGTGVHSQAGEGEFSDITKMANVFFDLGAFNFPTILVDTPGVNDPFLMRDEITRQSLSSVDICVVILTARQPLSTADLSLLRMLRGLSKNRLIIFINKVDEIEGGEEVLRGVSQNVAAILKNEFPSAHIPIVLGSALWARKALFPQDFGQGTYREDPATHPRESAGAEIRDWPNHDEFADTVAAGTFFLKSGLSALAVEISELMRTGTIAEAVEAAETLIETLRRNSIACLEIESAILSKYGSDPIAARNEAARLKTLGRSLSARIEAFAEKLARIYTEKVTELNQNLVETVHNFVAANLVTSSENSALANISQLDLRLRVGLENAFLKDFENAAQSVFAEQERLRAEWAELLEGSGLEGLTLIVNDKAVTKSTPSLAALGEPIALELPAGFEDLFAKQMPPEERSAALTRAIIADFDPIVVTLSDEAARALNDLSASLMQQMKTLTLRPLESTIQRIFNVMGEMESEQQLPGGQLLEQEVQRVSGVISKLKLMLVADAPALGAQEVTNQL